MGIAITIMITILTITTTMMMKSIATHQRMVSSFATTMIFTIHHFTKKVITSIATPRMRLPTLRLVTSIITSIATTMITAVTPMIINLYATALMITIIATTLMNSTIFNEGEETSMMMITSIAITTLITSIATTMITAKTKMITSIATGSMMNTVVTTMMITNASMKLYTIGIMSSIMITDIMITTMAITIKNTLSTSFCIKSCRNDFKFCTAFTMMKCFC